MDIQEVNKTDVQHWFSCILQWWLHYPCHLAILMYKVKNNMCPAYISTLFEQPAIKYELRNHDFTIPRFNTVSFGKHSLRYMGPRVWSSVPSNVKKASTLSSFKYNIRKVDLSMLLDDNNCSNCSLCTS